MKLMESLPPSQFLCAKEFCPPRTVRAQPVNHSIANLQTQCALDSLAFGIGRFSFHRVSVGSIPEAASLRRPAGLGIMYHQAIPASVRYR